MEKRKTYPTLKNRNLSALFSFINLSFIQGSNVLVQILLIPVITRIVGLSEFGLIMLSSSYAALISILINYGSNQSGVKDVALHKQQPKYLSEIFYSIYFVRILLFILSFFALIMISNTLIPFTKSRHFLFANMIILSEMLNPFFFFVGIQKLFLYNIVTLVTKIIAVILIMLVVKGPEDSVWVNFLLGAASVTGYLFLFIMLVKKYNLYHFQVPLTKLKRYIKHNFYLTGNNICVQLLQSVFLFTVSAMGDPILLGAYSLCDKFVWSFRMMIISFFNVIYPRAAILFKEDPLAWKELKKKLNTLLWVLFSGTALMLFFMAGWIVLIVTGKQDALTTFFLQSICLMPLVSALNSLNVIELLLRNRYNDIFRIAVILLAISILLSFLFVQWGNTQLFGLFSILVEVFSIPLYLYFIKRTTIAAFSKA